MSVRVLVVDDHPMVRQGLVALLSQADGVEAHAVGDGSLAAQAVLEFGADVVLMDLSMPGVDGLEATRAVLAASPGTVVVVLTSFAEHDRITSALAAGARGYLLKDAEPEEILRGVRDAAAGHAPFSARAATALLPGTAPRARGGLEHLTAREREVLALVAEGLPNKSIARRLGISEKTVKAHLTRVFGVLGVSDRTSAALWAHREGLTS